MTGTGQAMQDTLVVESDGASPQGDNKRSELKYRALGWWWSWHTSGRRRDIQWRRGDGTLWQRHLLWSLDSASPDTILLAANRTNVAARARLIVLLTSRCLRKSKSVVNVR
jgi:hypothetical protein